MTKVMQIHDWSHANHRAAGLEGLEDWKLLIYNAVGQRPREVLEMSMVMVGKNEFLEQFLVQA